MDIKKKKIIKAILVIILIIIMLLLFMLWFRGKSLSKYKRNVNSTAVTEVAKPVFVVNGASDIKIDGIEDTVYKFNVKNFDSTGRSETALKYFIEIVNNSQAELNFILTNNGKPVTMTNNKTGLFSLSSLTNQTDEYELRIEYNNNPAIATDIDGNVQIKVEAVQAE